MQTIEMVRQVLLQALLVTSLVTYVAAKAMTLVDVEECVNKDLCNNGGICRNVDGADECICVGTGFTGDTCTNKISNSKKVCDDGSKAKTCGFIPPCYRVKCENFPNAECRVSDCGRRCYAEWWDGDKEVTTECKNGQDWLVMVTTDRLKQAGTFKAKLSLKLYGSKSESNWLRLTNNNGLADLKRDGVVYFIVATKKEIGKIQSIKLRYGSWGWWKPVRISITDRDTYRQEDFHNYAWFKKPQIVTMVPTSEYAEKDECQHAVRECYASNGGRSLEPNNKFIGVSLKTQKEQKAEFDNNEFCSSKEDIFTCIDNVQCNTGDTYAEVYKDLTDGVCSSTSGINWDELPSDSCMHDQTKANLMTQHSEECRKKYGYHEETVTFHNVDDVCSAIDNLIACDMKAADICGPGPVVENVRSMYRIIWTVQKKHTFSKYAGEPYNCEINIP